MAYSESFMANSRSEKIVIKFKKLTMNNDQKYYFKVNISRLFTLFKTPEP